MTNPLIEQKVKELAESLPIAVRWSHGALEDPYHSLIRQALLSLYNQGQVDGAVKVEEWIIEACNSNDSGGVFYEVYEDHLKALIASLKEQIK